jgi:hypothetical protein
MIQARTLLQFAVGVGTFKLVDWGFDYLLYPFAIYALGLLWGGLVMAALSFVFCVVALRFYDWSKRDWLGIEAIKSFGSYRGSSTFLRFLSLGIAKRNWAAVIVLSIKFDPFVTTAFMREGQFSKLLPKDWRVFWTSWVIGNVYWTFLCAGGLASFKYFYEFFLVSQ